MPDWEPEDLTPAPVQEGIMATSFVRILLIAIVLGVLLYFVNRYVPMAPNFKEIVNTIGIIGLIALVVLWVLDALGIHVFNRS